MFNLGDWSYLFNCKLFYKIRDVSLSLRSVNALFPRIFISSITAISYTYFTATDWVNRYEQK